MLSLGKVLFMYLFDFLFLLLLLYSTKSEKVRRVCKYDRSLTDNFSSEVDELLNTSNTWIGWTWWCTCYYYTIFNYYTLSTCKLLSGCNTLLSLSPLYCSFIVVNLGVAMIRFVVVWLYCVDTADANADADADGVMYTR